MEKGDEDEIDDHQNQWPNRSFDTEKTDEADNSEVRTGRGLLQRSRVDKALGIDVGVENEEQVVPIGQVDQVKSDGSEAKD